MIRRPKLTEIPVYHPREATPVEIVGDGAISTAGVGDGRMLPVLILGTQQRPDIVEYIQIHQHGALGDVNVQWGEMPEYSDTVMLILSFIRPVQMKVIVAFDLRRNHGFLVEQILLTNGVYIQAGASGDRLKNTMDQPRIVIEIPDTGFRRQWDRLFLQHTVTMLRERGLDRKQAKAAAPEAIAQLREIGAFRMGSATRNSAPEDDENGGGTGK
ncbi:hypothetical protein [Novosphingobium sp. KN65.2]|uniref:hypothetical protein n=1 Tax=Novosphingobium sp. KN65.2 TaxID=1478134 RepID=UPI0005E6BF53|nr:hypothetical protein [Novosphingobium sp. KN65.2]CDO38566.1 hypothetical protein SPHV1_620019 [Novosphingobium sp. KN65.2]